MIRITKLSSALVGPVDSMGGPRLRFGLSFRTYVVAALAVMAVGLPPLVAQAQDSGATSSCFDFCHDGAMEMLENGYPMWAVQVGYKGCMQISCGYDMDG